MLARVVDLARRRRVAALVVALVLLALGASSLASSYSATQERIETTTREVWAERAAYAYSVPVVRNATHWPIGTVLPMGLPAYYRTVSDSFDVAFEWSAPATSGTVTADMTLHVIANAPDGRAYWSIDHPLAFGETRAPEPLRLAARLDMDALVEEVDRVTRELPPGEGKIVWRVETTLAYALDVEGSREIGTSAFAFPIVVQEPRFMLPQAPEIEWTRPHEETQTSRTSVVTGAPGALSDLRGLALALAGALGVALVAWLALGDPMRHLRGREAAYAREHLRHREWITSVPGALDVSSFPAAVVDVADLETLIETAADARTRVLHDPSHRIYYAVLPNATYRYARHARG